MGDRLTLALGEERAVHLPPLPEGEWSFEIDGMTSAIGVRKLWPADPYPEDDEDEGEGRPPPDVVFMVRATSPGSATIRFAARGGSPRGPATTYEVEVTVPG
jgi:hypothetical protein